MIIIYNYTICFVYLEPEIIQPEHIPRAPLVLSPILTVENKIEMKESESMYTPQDNQKVAQLIYIFMKIL